jgi:hypothetical protein
MSMKNSILRRCNAAIMDHFKGIKLEKDKPDVPVIYGDAEQTREWGFDTADAFLNDFKTFCLTQRFPIISVSLNEHDLSKRVASFDYEVNVLAIHKDHLDNLTDKVATKIAERKAYKVSPTVSGTDLDIKGIRARQWRFNIEIDGLGGWSNDEKEGVLLENCKEKLEIG